MSHNFAQEFNEALSTLHSIWISIGLDQNEIEYEKSRLEQDISSVFTNFVNSTSNKLHLMEQEIEQTLNSHAKLLQAFHHNEDEVEAILHYQFEGTLKKKLQTVKENYDKFYVKCEKQIMTFKSIQSQLDEMFGRLGIINKGEFAEIGDEDYSMERLTMYQKKLKEMKTEIQSRSEAMKEKKKAANELLEQLGEDFPTDILLIFDSDLITDESFKEVNNFIRGMEAEKEKRIKVMSVIANEIMRLWELLEVKQSVRQKFLHAHSTLSHDEIESCQQELDRLRSIRNEKLPELILSQKKLIQSYYDYLQIAEIEIPQFDESDPERAFKLYEDVIIRLEAEKKKCSQYIDLILKREEYLNELDGVNKDADKFAKLQAKGKSVDMKKLNKNEQARRRIKSILPRLEKSLLLLLIEYKEDNDGNEFLWRGEPYIQNLQHIILNDVELSRAKKKSSRKKSMQPKKEVCSLIGDKGAPRRFSENNRMLVNLK